MRKNENGVSEPVAEHLSIMLKSKLASKLKHKIAMQQQYEKRSATGLQILQIHHTQLENLSKIIIMSIWISLEMCKILSSLSK